MKTRIFAGAFLVLAAGCTTDQSLRYEGVTRGAGDAIAANTVMQMVDPWPRGVERTDISIPADHHQYRKRKSAADEVDGGGNIALTD